MIGIMRLRLRPRSQSTPIIICFSATHVQFTSIQTATNAYYSIILHETFKSIAYSGEREHGSHIHTTFRNVDFKPMANIAKLLAGVCWCCCLFSGKKRDDFHNFAMKMHFMQMILSCCPYGIISISGTPSFGMETHSYIVQYEIYMENSERENELWEKSRGKKQKRNNLLQFVWMISTN